ncbi:MAG: TIGR00341 family protein [Gemmatimonadota bacterium]|nr:TIGR00341 family protein [Gemmatimonadota bacterium]
MTPDPLTARARRALSGMVGWLNADDRRAIFDESAGGATDTGASYWLVLLLAGSIALLGLALNSAAVVIGAMLIAPLLAPVVGLAMALAIGDGRLAVQTAVAVLVSTVAVIATAALLTVLLPFHDITAEIASRTRPTTLDLAVAVLSGLAGAVVTVARGNRLAGAVPGVAVSVALVPPLAVTGFGIGSGWDWAVMRGSLLLYGANLAGIVMSAMIVFIVAGMHRPEVLEEVGRWHRESATTGLAAWAERAPGVRSLGILRSTWARVLLVLVFVALVVIPLSASLRQITREARVQSAVQSASKVFSRPGRGFIVSREVAIGQDRTQVILNVATTRWFDDSTRRGFELRASAAAGEPVDLVLDQMPASSRDLGHLATMIAARDPARAATQTPPAALPAVASIAALRSAVGRAVRSLALPDSLTLLGFVVSLGDSSDVPRIRLRYLSRDSLSSQAREMLRRQLASALQLPALALDAEAISLAPRTVSPGDAPTRDTLAAIMRASPALRLVIAAGRNAPQARVDSAAAALVASGVPAARLSVERTRGSAIETRVVQP